MRKTFIDAEGELTITRNQGEMATVSDKGNIQGAITVPLHWDEGTIRYALTVANVMLERGINRGIKIAGDLLYNAVNLVEKEFGEDSAESRVFAVVGEALLKDYLDLLEEGNTYTEIQEVGDEAN